MKKHRFAIPSLIAAGLVASSDQALAVPKVELKNIKTPTLLERLKLQHLYTLAGHRSHSSHSSHRSSSGTSYRPRATPLYTAPAAPTFNPAPSRNLNSTPPSSVFPSAPAAALKTLPGNSNKFMQIAMQVQSALYAYGYYTGNIDGKIGPESKIAISKMQADYKLKVTGTITPELLNALNIIAQ